MWSLIFPAVTDLANHSRVEKIKQLVGFWEFANNPLVNHQRQHVGLISVS